MVYKASLDKLAIGITIGVCSLMAFVPFQLSFLYTQRPGIFFAVTSFSIGLILICWLYHSSKYSIESTTIVIHRPVGKVFIGKHEISNVKGVTTEDFAQSIRTFGVGGLFGYFGKFYNMNFGSATWYATRRDRGVLITKKNGKKILLTPDNSTEFINSIKKN